MIAKSVRWLLSGSLLLLIVATLLWYIAPPKPEQQSEIEVLKVGAHETWLIVAGVSLLLSVSLGIAGFKLWLRSRADEQARYTLLG